VEVLCFHINGWGNAAGSRKEERVADLVKKDRKSLGDKRVIKRMDGCKNPPCV
jgi:hypothetical protein